MAQPLVSVTVPSTQGCTVRHGAVRQVARVARVLGRL